MKSKPRVCILRRDYYPMLPHVRRNAETLVSEGFEVDVVCMKGPAQSMRETVNGVNVYRIPLTRRRLGRMYYMFEYLMFFLIAAAILTWFSVRRRYDAIEVDTMPDFLVFAALLPKLLGVRVVLYLFECMPELFEDTYKLSRRHPAVRLLRLIERQASRFADHVLYCGPGYRDIQLPRVGKPIQSTVVLNVPDELVFHTKNGNRVTNGRTDESFRVITHGSLLEKYGIQTLIKAVPILKRRIPNLEVLIAGDGEYKSALKEMSNELGVQGIVKFTGLLPAERVAELISESNVGVVAIQHPYMLPSKLFEYMAVGIPTVSSSIDFIKSMCPNGEVSFFAPGDEAELAKQLISLYENPSKRLQIVEQADKMYDGLRWSIMKERYIGVYHGLIRNGQDYEM